MASIQDRLKIKRESCDTWSTREQLCLASSVLKSGDQNWISVSRSLKPFAEKEALRPPDWFSQKSCAVQYAILLENADTPKRKKRESGETTGESIVRRLRQERIAELGQILAFQRDEYQQLKAEVNLLKSGTITDEKLQKMWLAIDQEEREQEQKARAHSAWLAKRQQKMDVSFPQTTPSSTPKKTSESTSEPQESIESTNGSEEEKKNRSGQTALLTSLLTSPAQTTQISNTTSTAQVTSPTIASLLGANTKIHTTQPPPRISSQLHQLVTSTMSTTTTERPSTGAPTLSMLLALPANLSRGTISSLPSITAQSSISEPVTTPSRISTSKQITQSSSTVRVPVVATTTEIQENESMVQIIDHIDDVIGKDKIVDVIDKDEINEIIGDIEELIKEEITGNPQPATSTPQVIEVLPEPEKLTQVQERSEPRDIDERVSLSSSPESEMAIEDIDQSTSNIAKIIGTAIEPAEPKAIVQTISERDTSLKNKPEEIQKIECEEKISVDEYSAMEINEHIGAPENNEQQEEIKQKYDDNNDTIVEVVETKEKVIEIEEEVCDKIVENQIEYQAPEAVTVVNYEPEKISETTDEPEKKNDRVQIDSKEEKTEDIVKKCENFTEIEVKSPCVESTVTKAEELEKEEGMDGLPEITKEEETVSEQSIESSISEKIKYEVSNPPVVVVESEVKPQDYEKRVESLEIFQDMKKEQNDDAEESTIKEELDHKIEPTASIAFTVKTVLTDPDVIPEPNDTNIVTQKHEIDNAIEEKETKLEDSIVKEEVNEENTRVIEKMISEEVRAENPTEVTDVEEIKDVTEVKMTREIMPIKKMEEVKVVTEVADIVKELKDVKETKEVKEVKEIKDAKEVIDVKDIKDIKEVKELKEIKDVKETTEINEMKEIRETKVEKTEKTEKLDKAEKVGRDDASKKKKEDEAIEVKKEEPTTTIIDDTEMEEEESSLTKLNAGRAMKTYSKKQNVAVDSEPETESSGEGADYRAWKKAVMLVYNRLATHKYASVFLRPITEDQAPGYHSVIFRPMDLSTIKKNIDNGTIRSTMHFQRDVMLMFQNAIMYNKHDTFVYQMAVSMQEECLQHMQILVEVTGEGSFRRETRTAASSSSETGETNAIKRKRSHITPSPHETESPRMKKRRKSEND